MLRVITAPLRIGLSVAGGVLGFVRSRVLGESETVPAPAPPRPAPSPPSSSTPSAAEEAPASEEDEEAPIPPGATDPDDLVLLDRVKSEIFRPGDAEKGSVNVNVENGVVFLRGELDDPDQIEYFEVAAAEVDGVVRVENLIASGS